MSSNYEDYKKIADYIKEKAGFEPEIGIILGSCAGSFADRIKNPFCLDYKDIPGFLVSTVKSHAGKLIFGELGGKRVVCMSGRFHTYEGYEFEQLTLPVRVLKCLGVCAVIITNASGAINESYAPGDVVVIKDHIKMTGNSPLRGKNVEEFGPRFFDTTNMYTKKLREFALKLGEGSGLNIYSGTYFFFTGPQFETPAEIKAARILGGDIVGMSTVTDALTAAHCNMPLLALAIVTNMAAGITGNRLTAEETDVNAKRTEKEFGNYLENIVEKMNVREFTNE